MTRADTIWKSSLLIAAVLLCAPAVYSADAASTTTPPPQPVDQHFTLDMQPHVLGTADLVPSSSLNLTQEALRNVIDHVLQASLVCPMAAKEEKTSCIRDDTYYILHLVEHEPGTVTQRRDLWYVYFEKWATSPPFAALWDTGMTKHYREARLYGARRVTLLYLHYNVRIAIVDKQQAALTAQLEKTLTGDLSRVLRQAPSDEASRNAAAAAWWKDHLGANQQFLRASLEKLTPPVPSVLAKYDDVLKEALRVQRATEGTTASDPLRENERELIRLRSAEIVADALNGALKRSESEVKLVGPNNREFLPLSLYDAATQTLKPMGALVENSFLPIVYRVEITKKDPAVLTTFGDMVKAILQGVPTQIRAAMEPPAYGLCAVKEGMQVDYITSDVVIKGLRGSGDKPTDVGLKKFDNERKYHLDFSFAAPLKGLKEVTVNDSTGQVVQRATNKKHLFAAVNVFPVAVDTKRIQWRLIPQFIYGMNITGKPLDKHLFAIGIGTSIVQPFFGRVWDRTDPADRNDKKWTWTWGINISPRAVLSSLKSAAGAK